MWLDLISLSLNAMIQVWQKNILRFIIIVKKWPVNKPLALKLQYTGFFWPKQHFGNLNENGWWGSAGKSGSSFFLKLIGPRDLIRIQWLEGILQAMYVASLKTGIWPTLPQVSVLAKEILILKKCEYKILTDQPGGQVKTWSTWPVALSLTWSRMIISTTWFHFGLSYSTHISHIVVYLITASRSVFEI